MSFHPKMAYGATFHKSSRRLEDEGPAFVYTQENRARFDAIVTRYPPDRRRSAVLPALYLVQYQQGYVTANAMRYVADLIGMTAADVEDVVSYYTMFYTKPMGRFVLSVCRTLSCALNGAERVTDAICGHLKMAPGETDASKAFTLTATNPARNTAATATGYCSTFGIMIATRAPRFRPLLCSHAASASESSSSSPKLSALSMQT